tara:strand:+ start:6266 stop:7255 length:990 start_codon:yes stop_codon:yes gene_type:complete
MSTTTSYITTATSGADDYPDLSTWNDAANDGGAGGEQIAILKQDIVDNVSLTSWTSAVNFTIKSDRAGVKRTVTSSSEGSGGTHMIYSADADAGSLTMEDIILDGTGQSTSGAGRSGVFTANGTDLLTLRRVHIKNVTQHSILVWSNSRTDEVNCDNCIFENPGGTAYRGALDTMTATFRNCLFADCDIAAQNSEVEETNVGNYYNCLSFGNGGDDFAHANTDAETNVRHCVSQDSTAADGNHDDNTGSVGGKTSTGTYFRDYANGDYRLRHDDYTNWTINGEAANTPATDFDNKTRRFNDIGPFEYFYEDSSSIGQPTAKPIARAIAR